MTNRKSSGAGAGTTRAQEVHMEQQGQSVLFPTHRHGVGAWGGYRAGSGRRAPRVLRRGHSVYVTDQEWTAIQKLIHSMRANGGQDV